MCRAQTGLPSNVAGEVAWDVEDVPLSGATALLPRTMLHNDHMPMIKVTVTIQVVPGVCLRRLAESIRPKKQTPVPAMRGWRLFELICAGSTGTFHGARPKYRHGEEFGGFGGHDGRRASEKGISQKSQRRRYSYSGAGSALSAGTANGSNCLVERHGESGKIHSCRRLKVLAGRTKRRAKYLWKDVAAM